MELKEKTVDIPSGWVGGFAESNPAFAYPNPDLTSLPMPDNMLNINRLQRQQAVKWPEFSWETQPDEKDTKRCYQMFAPDISRIGYTDEGRVFSIICPQQGITSPLLGTLNVEVTVTGTRGWVNEDNRELAADMGVIGKVWFSPPKGKESFIIKAIQNLIWNKLEGSHFPFPFAKSQAIMVTTHKVDYPEQPVFPVRRGLSTGFPIPDFAMHEKEAWTVGNLGVQIGPIVKTGYPVVDEFNQLIMDIFNLGSGNMLLKGNVLTWNVWFTSPELVDQNEWASHAWRWRQSIDADHGSPDGPGTEARYYDGSPFKVDLKSILEEERGKLIHFLRHFEGEEKDKILSAIKDI
ncbi:hypothetical protein [Tenacibaculum xiamenense]|uniref:hypothetical protein n=1 Tax=Tenacibaculum xiamenense TaxID=1261553 RepID=UPI0038945DEA